MVADASMTPTLRPGDRLRVDLGAYRRHRPVVGDVVVLVDPEESGRWLVKRVAAVDPTTGHVDVRGDAAELARDSRQFGTVPPRTIVGRVYRRYFPPERARDL